MKLKNFYLDIKSNNKDLIVLVKYGNFYKCFEDDSYIINYLLNYKINNKNSLGFPINIIDKVLSILKDNNISCIVINDIDNYVKHNCIENNYNSFLDKSKKNYNLKESERINNINKNIMLEKDIDNCFTININIKIN